jgi:hypothetical protein
VKYTLLCPNYTDVKRATTTAAHLKRCRLLLDLARSKAEITKIRWRSEDLGSWDSIQPRWRVVGGKIRIQFRESGHCRTYWIASVKQRAWGVTVFLADSGSPIPEALEMAWRQPLPDFMDTRSLWKIAKYWLASKFPGHRVLRATKKPDLARTLSGSFLRVLFKHGGKIRLLVMADEASGDEAPQAIGQALLWLSTFSATERPGPVPMLYMLAPWGTSAILLHRSQLLNTDRINVEVWEYRDESPNNLQIRIAPEPASPEENKDFHWPVLGPFRWSSQLERVLNLAPLLIRRYPRFQDYDSLRLWGLEFAQVMGPERDRIFFGIGSQRTELTEDNFESLRLMVDEILYFRRPDSPDTRHPYYRLQGERWLEALVLEDIPRLFPEMAPESAYSQIPVYLGKDSGRIDVLCADRNGALVVMELKVSADPDLPIQALDYWGRVIRHNEKGDFERRGYFSEIRLTRQRPRLYLISPVFSFHDTTESLLRYLKPGLEVCKISINEDWRCGVKIIRRIQYRCSEIGSGELVSLL